MDVYTQMKNVLSHHPIFSAISPTDLAALSERAERFEQGEPVFSAGESSDRMYVVADGEVAVTKRTGEYTADIEIARLVAGDSLGEMEMITSAPRAVTATAATALTLVPFPPKPLSFVEWLAQNPTAGSRVLFGFIANIADRTRTANTLLKENSPQIQELRRQIYEDKLTGLQNKVALDERLPEIVKGSEGGRAALLLFKPDNFKTINDEVGHEAGDALLVRLAQLLPAIIPEGALLMRYAGNEFGVALRSAGRDEARSCAEKIRDFYNGLDVSAQYPNKDFRLTVSVGIACSPEHGGAPDIIEKAHALPLAGRAAGGNKILFHEDNPGESR